MTAKNRGAWLMLLAVTVIWGYTWVAQKIGLNHLGPFSFSVFRFFIGSLTLIGIMQFRRNTSVTGKDLPCLAVLGMLMTTGTFAFWMLGMRDVSAGSAALIAYTMPMWTMLMAHRFLGESLTVNKIAGLAAGLGGLVLVADPSASTDGDGWKGSLFVLLGAISWAAGNVLLKARFSSRDMVAVTGIQMAFGTVGLLFLSLLFEPAPFPERWSLELVALILFTGLFSSAFSFFAWFYALSRLQAVQASVSVLLVPVFALLFDWLQLGEPITWRTAAGCALVLTGIGLVQRSDGKGSGEETRPEEFVEK